MTASTSRYLPRLFALLLAVSACDSELPAPPPPAQVEIDEQLQRAAAELLERSAAPGVLLAVAHGTQRWRLAAGHADLPGLEEMPAGGVFRAGSIAKLL